MRSAVSDDSASPPPDEAVPFADPEVEPGAEAPAEAAPPPEDPLATARAEAQRFREQLLRTAADFDNFRKRARRDLDDERRRAKEDTVRELFPVFDNLERAIQAAATASDPSAVADGVRMVLKLFADALGKLDIRRVETVGQPFDPALMEAIQHLPTSDHPPGAVAAEVQAGYMLGDRVVRPALVVVAKAPPEPDA